MIAALAAEPTTAQQADTPSSTFKAERDAASEALSKAEASLNAGQRGRDTEACKQMVSYFDHTVRAAAVAGAKTRIADWPDLAWDEQNAVMEKLPAPYDRNKRLRLVACSGG